MGVGSDTFVKLLSSCHTPQETLDKIDKEFKLGYHKAAKMAEIARWAKMWAVTSLDGALLESIFIRPFRSLQDAIDAAIAEKGEERILFLMNAALTVPKLRKMLVYRPRKFVYSSRWGTTIPIKQFGKPEVGEEIENPLAYIYSEQ